MERFPVARRSGRQNAILDLVNRSREIIDATTPEAEPVDRSLFDPIERNPNIVNEAIASLTQSRVEANSAANELERENFNRQMQGLILQNLLGVGGAIGNLGGSGTVTGIDQNIQNTQQQARSLQDRLTQGLIDRAREDAIVQGEAGVRTATNEEEARLANEQERQAQDQAFAAAVRAERDIARQTGADVREVAQQEIENLNQERRLAREDFDAQTRRITALRPRSTSRSGTRRIGDPGFLGEQVEEFRRQRASRQEAERLNAETDDPLGELGLAEDAAQFSIEQKAQRESIREAARNASQNEITVFLSRGVSEQDTEVVTMMVDELQVRLATTPNDPELKALEARLNEGLPAEEAVSLGVYLQNLEDRALAGFPEVQPPRNL